MSDRPTHCPHCGRPDGVSVLTANNGRMYVKPSKVIGANPATGVYEEYTQNTWHNIKGEPMYPAGHRMFKDPTESQIKRGLAEGKERKDIKGNEIRLKVESEFVHLTKVMSRDGSRHLYLCALCRGNVLAARAAADRKSPTENMDALFDLKPIDEAGKAKREKAKKHKRDLNVPVTDSYQGSDAEQ